MPQKRYDESCIGYENTVKNLAGKVAEPSVADIHLHPTHRRLIGNSRSMRKIKNQIAQIARTEATALITGDTGTGKDLAAEYIHRQSDRRDRPFVCVDCAALPENLVESELFGHEKGAFTGAVCIRKGKFEIACGGSIFLDEIGDMPLALQSKLLRVIENKTAPRIGGHRSIPFDVRIIAATNRELEREVDCGRFRMDLYYRLNIAGLHMPPLLDRKSDIPLLIHFFVEKLNRRYNREVAGFSEVDLNALYRYHWPGNVRELQNVVESAFIHLTDKTNGVLALPDSIRQRMTAERVDQADERRTIVSALIENEWNKTKAARKLNWSRMTVYRKMKKYKIVEERKPAR